MSLPALAARIVPADFVRSCSTDGLFANTVFFARLGLPRSAGFRPKLFY
jgi:hypothetical protein